MQGGPLIGHARHVMQTLCYISYPPSNPTSPPAPNLAPIGVWVRFEKTILRYFFGPHSFSFLISVFRFTKKIPLPFFSFSFLALM